MENTVKNNQLVITGQFLGVIEEFLPDKRTTFVREGEIFATKTGMVSIDHDKKSIKVETKQEEDRKIVKIGDIVIGTILFLRKYSVGLNFYTINGKIHFNSSYFGNIHVSNISNRYVERIDDAFQITDIIRAKVTEEKSNEYVLSTVGKDLGVIHADCAICGTKLKSISYDKLRCPRCGNLEKRKMANDYGNVSTHLRF